jgi:putative transferase (TIGR04331 family)
MKQKNLHLFSPNDKDHLKNDDHYFLGPWCRIGKVPTNEIDLRVITSPWRSNDKLSEANLYCLDLVRKLIPVISERLNEQSHTKHSLEFWKIRLGVWFLHVVQTLYDRYIHLKTASEFASSNNFQFLIVSFPLVPTAEPTSMIELSRLLREMPINAWFFDDILKQIPLKNLIYECPTKTDLIYQKSVAIEPLRARVSNALNEILQSKNFHIGLVHGISLKEKFKLAGYRFKISSLKAPDPMHGTKIRASQIVELLPANEFEKFLYDRIMHFLPDSFLNEYSIANLPEIIVGLDPYVSDYKNYRVARIKENGGKWFASQHGAGYGTCDIFPLEFSEYELSDGFFSWGWKDNTSANRNIINLPSPYLSKQISKPRVKHAEPKIIILSTANNPMPCRLHGALISTWYGDYFKRKVELISAVDKTNFKSLVYRPYAPFLMNETKWIRNEFPDISLDESPGSQDWMGNYDLVIHDHAGTGMFESIVRDIPTLLTWNESAFPATPPFSRVLEKLRQAGIFFESPRECAVALDEALRQGVNNWWLEPKRVAAVTEFRENFCQTSDDWLQQWKCFLQSI